MSVAVKEERLIPRPLKISTMKDNTQEAFPSTFTGVDSEFINVLHRTVLLSNIADIECRDMKSPMTIHLKVGNNIHISVEEYKHWSNLCVQVLANSITAFWHEWLNAKSLRSA